MESFDDSESFDVDNVVRAAAFAVVSVVWVGAVAVVVVVAAAVIVVVAVVVGDASAVVEAVAVAAAESVAVVEANVGDGDVVSVVDALELILMSFF